jgi:cadmium resistance protein CadD (predicted permease)
VGTGISVYTAFLAFGAVRYVPELALSPVLWSIPLIIGVSLILYHQRAATAPLRRTRTKAAA